MNATVEDLRLAFAFLDELGFQRTCRLPLVAARQWRLTWEREALRRFRDGLSNIHEVAWPKLYWKAEEPSLRRAFESLTLGLCASPFVDTPELRPLFGQSNPQGVPDWSVVSRFGRYIVRSHPQVTGDDYVYLGDDTLFLMQKSRDLLEQLLDSGKEFVRCLDLCCGGGGVGLALPPLTGQLRGVDLNEKAIELAKATALAQGIENYQYECLDISSGLSGEYDLIFGNPPTLSPRLAGREVLYATGTTHAFIQTLEEVLNALSHDGRAVFTFFSEVETERDLLWQGIDEVLGRRRGFRCEARREYPLGGQKFLRHSFLELLLEPDRRKEFVSMNHLGWQLPGLKWRRAQV